MAIGKGVIARVNAIEPLMTRGAIVSAFGVLGMVLNHHFADGTVQYTGNIVLACFALVTAVVSRSKVTPNDKVVSYTPDPANPNQVKPGGAQDY